MVSLPKIGPTITRKSGRGNATEFVPGTLTVPHATVEVSGSANKSNIKNSGFLYVSKKKQNSWIYKEKLESSITLGGLYTEYQHR